MVKMKITKCPKCGGMVFKLAGKASKLCYDKCLKCRRAALGGVQEACPVCLVVLKWGDDCASDIELGTCHAACLEGSPTVDLDTGEPIAGPIPTFKFEPA